MLALPSRGSPPREDRSPTGTATAISTSWQAILRAAELTETDQQTCAACVLATRVAEREAGHD
jgi:hypothetical protein